MKKILFLSTMAALIMSGCTQREEELAIPSDQMQFAVEYPNTRATDTAFEPNDAMGVYVTQYDNDKAVPLQISGNYANNVKSTYNGTKWENSPAIYWADGKFDVFAYYPYDKPASVDEYKFSVALDQSTEETTEALGGYEASDFLWAKAAGVSRMDAVPLTFKHRMSKLVVNLVKGEDYTGDIPSEAVVRIHNTTPAAIIDLSSGVVTKNGYEASKSITAKKVADGVYTAIIVPQRLENKLPLIEVLSHGVSYLVESKFVFRSGMQHTVNLTLNNNPDMVRIEIGGEIENGWE
ncbi:MAG: fimbrillin family protein [Bacteroidaceae bacterium]|nr:fimbrillin family protein [Bacteroidaceae bacterium]